MIGWLCDDRGGPRASPRWSATGADPEAGVPGSGGLIGWAVGTPLSRRRRAASSPSSCSRCCAFFGLLVITATPVHQIPERLQELADRLLGRDYDDDDYDDEDDEELEEPPSRRRPPRRRWRRTC